MNFLRCNFIPMNGHSIQFLSIALLLTSLGCHSDSDSTDHIQMGREADLPSAQTPLSGAPREFREMVAAREMRVDDKRSELQKLTRELPELQNRAMRLATELNENPQDRKLQSEAAEVQVIKLRAQVARAQSELFAAQEAVASTERDFTPIPHDLLTK